MERYTIFNGKAEEIPTSFYNSFDICISLCSFEHLQFPQKVIAKISNALKPGGDFLTEFGPIWSCYCGHHAWVTQDLNFNNLGLLSDFCHLLQDPDNLRKTLRKAYSEDIITETIDQIYTSNRINRLFYDDYVHLFNTAPFSSCNIFPTYEKAINFKLQKLLKNKYPNRTNFTAYSIFAHLVK